ncbi:MAG: hypothetical protein M1826_003376 [Phylliscum demangeonii]|nr:MAG: hypothetical protein M1826_003376 [Phylliscum demangeonii]
MSSRSSTPSVFLSSAANTPPELLPHGRPPSQEQVPGTAPRPWTAMQSTFESAHAPARSGVATTDRPTADGEALIKQARVHLTPDDYLLLIRLCLAHKDKYQGRATAHFWDRIGRDFAGMTGKVIRDPPRVVRKLQAAREEKRQRQRLQSDALHEKTKFTRAIDEWLDHVQHSKEEKEKAVRHDLRRHHQWDREAERAQQRARCQPPLSSSSLLVAANVNVNVPERGGRDRAASFAAPERAQQERAREMAPGVLADTRHQPLSLVAANVPERGRDLATSFAAEKRKAHDVPPPSSSLNGNAQKRRRAYQSETESDEEHEEEEEAAWSLSDTRSVDRSRGDRTRKMPRRSRPDPDRRRSAPPRSMAPVVTALESIAASMAWIVQHLKRKKRLEALEAELAAMQRAYVGLETKMDTALDALASMRSPAEHAPPA